MKNVETFVRNLSAKNIQARLGLVEYEELVKLNTMISMDLSSQVIQKVSFLL